MKLAERGMFVPSNGTPITAAMRTTVSRRSPLRRPQEMNETAVMTESDTENHSAPQVVENTGEISWLGIRDDFRNWLIQTA